MSAEKDISIKPARSNGYPSLKLTYASLSVYSKIKPIATFAAKSSEEVDTGVTAETQLALVQVYTGPVVLAQREAFSAGALVTSGMIHTAVFTVTVGDQTLIHI